VQWKRTHGVPGVLDGWSQYLRCSVISHSSPSPDENTRVVARQLWRFFLRSQTVTCKTAPMGNCVSVAGLGWLGSVCGRLIGERVCGRRPSVVCRVTNLTHDCRRYFLFTFSPTVNGLFLDDARKIVLPKVFTARRYASAVYDVSCACLSVCSSVCLSQAGIMPDWLSINNHGKIVIR